MSTKRALYESWKKVCTSLSGPKSVSNFQATGTMTPKEFLEAGDALVQKLPVWEWASGPAENQPYLPPDKKYLVLRGAICLERAPAATVDNNDADVEDGWVSTHVDHVPQAKVEAQPQKEINWDDDDDDADGDVAEDVQERKCRLYDVFVTYDQFYQTPRVFLIGYSEKNHSQVLSKEEMMEDVYATNREKTVTMDPHPFLKAPCISIHPCRHAETMKRTLENLKDRLDGSQEDLPESERVDFVFPTYLAMFIFLKFISSVVPTIQYDVAIELEM
jgi:ubiquitin-like-conjugating enzyme ATG3